MEFFDGVTKSDHLGGGRVVDKSSGLFGTISMTMVMMMMILLLLLQLLVLLLIMITLNIHSAHFICSHKRKARKEKKEKRLYQFRRHID